MDLGDVIDVIYRERQLPEYAKTALFSLKRPPSFTRHKALGGISSTLGLREGGANGAAIRALSAGSWHWLQPEHRHGHN